MMDSKGSPAFLTNAKADLDAQGYFIHRHRLHDDLVLLVKKRLSQLSWRRTPLSDHDQSQSWHEANLEAEQPIRDAICSTGVRDLVIGLRGTPWYEAFWANSYASGEFIPRHTDNEGSLQLITAITVSRGGRGGEILLHHDRVRAVRLEPGQQLLFDATRTPHETTPIVDMSADCSRRTVCVTRFYI